jgi:NADH-quinone oxidoreductase subunit N
MSATFMDFLAAAMPESVVGLGICVVLLAGLFAGRRNGEVCYVLCLATLVAAAWATGTVGEGGILTMPGGAFVVDPLARLLKLFALAVMAVVLVYSRAYLRERRIEAGEFYLLALFALLGVLVMTSSASFLTMYLGLETLSLAMYAMVAFERDAPTGAEASMKYFVLGAIASGCLLYGISLVYGVAGSVVFSDIRGFIAGASGPPAMAALVGLGFIVVGIAFKFGAVPFHMWLPDVYQGAPACSTLFIATVPKLAALALAIRVLVEGLPALAPDWETMLVVLAVLSLAIGNLTAIVQTSIRRLLAYSTVGHVGFIFLGLVAGMPAGAEAALYYTLVYVLMSAGAFGIVILLSSGGVDADSMDELRGLNRRSPWFAGMMLLLMVSMIGVPPLAGFYAKWAVLSALVDAGRTWLALVGLVFSVIGAFYYLKVIRLMYFENATVQQGAALQPALDFRAVLTANSLVVLGLGIFPGPLLALCARVLG